MATDSPYEHHPIHLENGRVVNAYICLRCKKGSRSMEPRTQWVLSNGLTCHNEYHARLLQEEAKDGPVEVT